MIEAPGPEIERRLGPETGRARRHPRRSVRGPHRREGGGEVWIGGCTRRSGAHERSRRRLGLDIPRRSVLRRPASPSCARRPSGAPAPASLACATSARCARTRSTRAVAPEAGFAARSRTNGPTATSSSRISRQALTRGPTLNHVRKPLALIWIMPAVASEHQRIPRGLTYGGIRVTSNLIVRQRTHGRLGTRKYCI